MLWNEVYSVRCERRFNGTYIILIFYLNHTYNYLNHQASFNLRWICEHLPNPNSTACSWVYPITLKTQALGEVKQPPPAILSMTENSAPRPTQCISTWSCENLNRLIFVQQFSIFFLVLYFGECNAKVKAMQ